MPTIALSQRATITSRTSVVQLEYPPDVGPAPKPEAHDGEHWTRFVVLSDTHSHTFPVPDGDVLLHAGDLTQMGTLKDLQKTMEWLYALPHPIKIIIAGNHDFAIHREWYEVNWQGLALHRRIGKPESAEEVLELLKGPRAVAAHVVYLENEEYKFRAREGGKEWSVYGSPWTPFFGDWAFGYEKEDGAALLSKFPATDILLTHGPPENVLDLTNNEDRAGCAELAARLPDIQPRLHAFGHIHEARGAYVHDWKPDSNELGAQNALQLQYIDDSDDEDDDESDAAARAVVPEIIIDSADDTVKQTIFLNAANWPAGRGARRNGERVPMGGPGFQPVVVDLLE